MTTIDITDRLAPSRIGQATAVEQSRAVAEVQAAIVVAQQCPRDINRAVADMRRSCGQKSLAERAFFRYPRGKDDNGKTLYVTGPSVQLARELARCFGNVQYGIAELRRDDTFGQSEMLAFAWDVQTNTRSSTTFIVPHIRDTKKGSVVLAEQRDIYENNANNGARRLREMIFAILPGWYTEDGKAACYEAIEGDTSGQTLAERVQLAIDGFATRKVTAAQLEQKLGAPYSRWTAHDLAQLSVIYRSIQRGEVRVEDEFPAAAPRVTAADITGAQPPTPAAQPPADAPSPAAEPAPAKPAGRPAGKAALESLAALTGLLDLSEEQATKLIHWIAGPGYSATAAEVKNVVSFLEDHLKSADGDTDKASAAIWVQFGEANSGA